MHNLLLDIAKMGYKITIKEKKKDTYKIQIAKNQFKRFAIVHESKVKNAIENLFDVACSIENVYNGNWGKNKDKRSIKNG